MIKRSNRDSFFQGTRLLRAYQDKDRPSRRAKSRDKYARAITWTVSFETMHLFQPPAGRLCSRMCFACSAGQTTRGFANRPSGTAPQSQKAPSTSTTRAPLFLPSYLFRFSRIRQRAASGIMEQSTRDKIPSLRHGSDRSLRWILGSLEPRCVETALRVVTELLEIAS